MKYIKPEIKIIECEPFCVQYTSACHNGWRNKNTGEWKPGEMTEHGWKEYIGEDHAVWEWVNAKQSTFLEEEDV